MVLERKDMLMFKKTLRSMGRTMHVVMFIDRKLVKDLMLIHGFN